RQGTTRRGGPWLMRSLVRRSRSNLPDRLSVAAFAKRLGFVERVLAALPTLAIDLATARSHSQLWADLARRGAMIGVHDSWLAATCLAHGLRLATSNLREFTRVPGLDVEKWE
ncbi:MAG: hypothetical protein U1E05_10970, partial [Patescibacteria group bacterium]|nr:hypothetical protein [Patescibacteria group bacterium]